MHSSTVFTNSKKSVIGIVIILLQIVAGERKVKMLETAPDNERTFHKHLLLLLLLTNFPNITSNILFKVMVEPLYYYKRVVFFWNP